MRYILLTITSLMVVMTLALGGRVAAAGPFDTVCKNTPSATVCQDSKNPENANGQNSIYGPGSILAKATTLLALIVAIASVIVIIVGGIKFTVSGGDSNAVNSARNTVLYALIGLAIAATAEAIVVFIINKL